MRYKISNHGRTAIQKMIQLYLNEIKKKYLIVFTILREKLFLDMGGTGKIKYLGRQN